MQRQARQSVSKVSALSQYNLLNTDSGFSSRFVLESPMELSKTTTAQTQPKYGEL